MVCSAINTDAAFIHERDAHKAEESHHHHSHRATSCHTHGHHLLQIEDLTVAFRRYDESATAGEFFSAAQHEMAVLHNLSLSVHPGEVVAVVGASGSGKSLMADAIMGLFEPNALVTGRIWFDGQLQTGESLAALRGHGVSLVPQSVDSLDPLMPVGKQAAGPRDDRDLQRQLFERYHLDPEVARLYPFQLSGGMARRVLLCCALIEQPRVIIADEPTPGLDRELAQQALQDLRDLADQGAGVILISHDIELALAVSDRIAVFKDGTIVEETAVENFADPDLLEHPFSRALWHAMAEHDWTYDA